MRFTILSAIALLLSLPAVGCGGSDDRLEVSGKVTRQGRPVNSGTIAFTPSEDNSGPAAGGSIENGNFHIPAENGPGKGTYNIVVTTGGLRLVDKSELLGTKHRDSKSQPAENQSITFTRDLVADGSETQLEFELASPSAE